MHLGMSRVLGCMCRVITIVRQQKLPVFMLSLTFASASWGQIPFFLIMNELDTDNFREVNERLHKENIFWSRMSGVGGGDHEFGHA